jgi:hypothetical protein
VEAQNAVSDALSPIIWEVGENSLGIGKDVHAKSVF